MFSQKLNTHKIFKWQAKALIRLHACAGWSEALLVAHTTLLENTCHSSIMLKFEQVCLSTWWSTNFVADCQVWSKIKLIQAFLGVLILPECPYSSRPAGFPRPICCVILHVFCHMLIFYTIKIFKKFFQEYHQGVKQFLLRERSGSVVECLTQDRGAVGSSLTGVTVLCLWARTFILA